MFFVKNQVDVMVWSAYFNFTEK